LATEKGLLGRCYTPVDRIDEVARRYQRAATPGDPHYVGPVVRYDVERFSTAERQTPFERAEETREIGRLA
jgi:hypothetical protein